MSLTEYARAKVNLTLRVLGRRADGYHEIESRVVFAEVADRLVLYPGNRFELVTNGLALAAQDNLISKAVAAFAGAFGPQTGRLVLDKVLPVAAGLGGGSADAAATLRLLVRRHIRETGVAWDEIRPQVSALAEHLGSDVPVCFVNRPCLIRGRGEIVIPMAAGGRVPAVLVNPQVPVPANKTGAIFKALAAPPHPQGVTNGLAARSEPHADADVNHLESPARRVMPVVTDILDALLGQAGISAARMSGAGPTCFGLFGTADEAQRAANSIGHGHPTWWVKATMLG